MSPEVETSLPSLSVVIPAFNERDNILQALTAVHDWAEQSHHPCEIILVDDGSTDDTSDIAKYASLPGITLHVLRNASNRGKGYSLRRGVFHSTNDVVLLCDADMNTPVEEADRLLAALRQGHDLAIGSRALPYHTLNARRWQSLRRRIFSWLFRVIRRRLLLPQILDTQCGFKAVRQDAAHAVFNQATIDGYACDCEILFIARQMGYRIAEVPVRWTSGKTSTVRPLRDGLRMFRDIRAIRRRTSTANDR